jgi:hypothetical protein
MRYVRVATALFALVALAVLAAGMWTREPAAVLAGLLMSWAAAVKIVVAWLWRHLGTDRAVRAPEGSYR